MQKYKVQMRVTDTRLEQAITKCMVATGAVKKLGGPPRSGLERDAQRLLDAFSKK